MKCIVIETSPERINAKPVTNEDGSAHVYATISEARAELKANGYSYNRENQRYYIKGTEYRAYIIREDSEEYADAITTAEAHNRAAAALINAYAEAIGDSVTADDPEAIAAHRVARACIGLTTATDDDRATVSAMVEAIADRARETAAVKHYQTADAAARAAESFAEAAEWAADKIENDPAGDLAEWAHAARAFAAHAAEAANAARLICEYDRNTTFADYETSAYAAHALEYIDMRAADAAAAAARALAAAQRATDAETAAADPEDLEEPAPIYQRYELEAYLGEPEDYDVDAIEAEATRFTADGARVWVAFGEDLAAIAERHELYSYAPAI